MIMEKDGAKVVLKVFMINTGKDKFFGGVLTWKSKEALRGTVFFVQDGYSFQSTTKGNHPIFNGFRFACRHGRDVSDKQEFWTTQIVNYFGAYRGLTL